MAQERSLHASLFARIADYGLVNAHTLSGQGGPAQTLRHRNSVVPWQNDYLFISTGLVGRLKGYRVVDTGSVRQFSDHNIVVIDIEL